MELTHISPVKTNVCLICGKRHGSPTFKFTQNSWQKVFDASQLRDDQLKQRILGVGYTQLLPTQPPCYHKACYTTYTSKRNLSRFTTAPDQPGPAELESLESEEVTEPPPKRLRSSAYTYGLRETRCIFCLGDNKKNTLHKFQTVKGVTTVQGRNLVEVYGDYELHSRLCQDLIALEAKYHKNCHLRYLSTTLEEKPFDGDARESAFTELTHRLDRRLVTGTAARLADLCEEINSIILSRHTNHSSNKAPRRYTSSRLKLELATHYGDEIAIYEPKNKSQSQLIYSSRITLESVLRKASSATQGSNSADAMLQPATHLDDRAVLMQAATILRRVIIDNRNPVEEISKLSAESVPKVIPNELKYFMASLSDSKQDTELSGKVSSIAQHLLNIVKPMRTPKSICLAVAMKNLTNNKAVIDHLHRLGHCISYKDTLAIDKNMSDQILQNALEVEMVIPANIIRPDQGGGLIQAAADNIDFTEETLDGKNTTHATSAVLYQTNHDLVSGEFVESFTPKLSFKRKRPMTSTSLHLNTIKAFKDGTKIRELAVYRNRSDLNLATDFKYREGHLVMDEAWMLCRHLTTKLVTTTEQCVSSWSALMSRVSLPMTKTEIGYLPLWDRSPTDISTVYTVMVSIQELTNRLGQEHTIVTFDQAIYKIAKQIQWKRPSLFKHMVIRLGGFHILMNYLGTIGKMVAGSGVAELLIDWSIF